MSVAVSFCDASLSDGPCETSNQIPPRIPGLVPTAPRHAAAVVSCQTVPPPLASASPWSSPSRLPTPEKTAGKRSVWGSAWGAGGQSGNYVPSGLSSNGDAVVPHALVGVWRGHNGWRHFPQYPYAASPSQARGSNSYSNSMAIFMPVPTWIAAVVLERLVRVGVGLDPAARTGVEVGVGVGVKVGVEVGARLRVGAGAGVGVGQCRRGRWAIPNLYALPLRIRAWE